jgi:hypothetical protein
VKEERKQDGSGHSFLFIMYVEVDNASGETNAVERCIVELGTAEG